MEQIKKADFKDMAPNLFCKTSSSLAGDYSQALAGISQTQQRPANTHTRCAHPDTLIVFTNIVSEALSHGFSFLLATCFNYGGHTDIITEIAITQKIALYFASVKISVF